MSGVPDILARIVARKRAERAEKKMTVRKLERYAEASVAQRRDFRAALEHRSPAVIAEFKRASPSKGRLAADVDPAQVARQYAEGGAAALSVLTDRAFFQGSIYDLWAARTAVPLPVLRKDFTIDEYDVLEAAAAGADAVLLIVAILSGQQIAQFRSLAASYRMAALVEVHDAEELGVALAAGADLVGVNNRNLRTFEVTLQTSLDLAGSIPADVVKVSESGIFSRADVQRLQAAGFDAFLVGEHLMTAADPAAALRALTD
jgi:indole-3-glycerol phosphate synthase